MHAKPLKTYKTPGYPTRPEVIADPDLLRKNIPAAWLEKPEMAGLVGFMLTINASLYVGECSNAPPASKAIVAPIFEHGEGRGAGGCVAVARYVHLSEEDAMLIIEEELRTAGIVLPEKHVSLFNYDSLSYDQKYDFLTRKQKEHVSHHKAIFKTDAIDKSKKIAVEFVSISDYYSFLPQDFSGIKYRYDFRRPAATIDTMVKEHCSNLYFGTFYDPCYTPNSQVRASATSDWSKISRAESLRLLRLQVKDFIDWLKAQGAI